MNSILVKIRDKHALWYKGIVYVLSVLIIVYFLPVNLSKSLPEYQTLNRWPYPDLKADFDFSVKKTDQEIEQEFNAEKAKQIPYYQMDVQVGDRLIQYIDSAYKIKKQVIHHLDSAYQQGVIEASADEKETNLYLVKGSEAGKHLFSDFISLSDLELYLTKNDPELLEDKILINLLKPNVIYNEEISGQLNNHLTKDMIFPYKNKIKAGELIIGKQDSLTEEAHHVLLSYQEELKKQESENSPFLIYLGYFLTTLAILGIMMTYLAFFRKNIFSLNTHVTFIFLLIVLVVAVTALLYSYSSDLVFAVPFCLIPVLMRVFFDSRTALFSFLNAILVCSFFSVDKFQFVFIQLITGIGTIFSVADIGKRSQLFVSALVTFLFYVFSFVVYQLISNTSEFIWSFNHYIPFIISAACVLFSFPLIFLFEKLFGFISDFTLLELADLNSPLLRELSQKVPGTFQHSLQVANLAEEACYKIGGNPLLVRAGAMYHDIGKMYNPRYFTENQVGEVSPHEELSPEESAHIIIGHVIKGVEKAKEYKLPEQIIDFIRTHHGTTTTRFFLYHYKKEHAGEKINEDLFRYPGPIPFSKETAILMMADGVEAASRSLKKYDAIAIDELVDKIINHLINENQFLNSDITFREINQIKKIFKKRLMNIYHVRIEYPR